VFHAQCWQRFGLVADARAKGQDVKNERTAHAPPSFLFPFQKRSQFLKLLTYCQHRKCFWNRYNAAWPFRGKPSSDHAVPTAAVCNVMWTQLANYLVTVLHVLVFSVSVLPCLSYLDCCNPWNVPHLDFSPTTLATVTLRGENSNKERLWKRPCLWLTYGWFLHDVSNSDHTRT